MYENRSFNQVDKLCARCGTERWYSGTSTLVDEPKFTVNKHKRINDLPKLIMTLCICCLALKCSSTVYSLHCRKSWRNISFPSDISELFHEDIITNISEKCSP
jgi:hypothetical protein